MYILINKYKQINTNKYNYISYLDMNKHISKLQKNKTKKNTKIKSKTSLQKGSGFFADNNAYYFTNIRYNDSRKDFKNPILQCSICKDYKFKMKVMKVDTQATAFLTDGSFYGNAFNFFTCVNCGNIHILSNNTKFTKDKDKPDILNLKSNKLTRSKSI